MTKLFFVCQNIGSGTDEDPYRATAADDRVHHGVLHISDDRAWCVIAVRSEDAGGLSAGEQVEDVAAGIALIASK